LRAQDDHRGKKLNLKSSPSDLQSRRRAKITCAPAKSCLVGTPFFGGPAKFVVAGSGHTPASSTRPEGKYQYWTGGEIGRRRYRSLARQRTEHPGSWWPDWLNWLKNHYERKVKARKPGGGKLKAIERRARALRKGQGLISPACGRQKNRVLE